MNTIPLLLVTIGYLRSRSRLVFADFSRQSTHLHDLATKFMNNPG